MVTIIEGVLQLAAMSPEAAQTVSPNTAAQNGVGPEGKVELLGPPMFSRVQEPDSDGQVYDIEILGQPIGYQTTVSFPFFADLATEISDDDDSHRLAACTLRIGAPIDKNRQRMVDGKIENLWLKDEGTANRLDNVRMLATLLGYVRSFCAGIEVPHISSIQKFDHPAWLRDFFTIAGFNRCECLKPEAGTQRYRACLKLGSPNRAAVQEIVAIQSTSETKDESYNHKVKEKGKEDGILGVTPSPHASAGLTVREISPTKQQKPSLNLPKVTEAIMAKQRPSANLPKVTETASLGNGQHDKGSKSAEPTPAKRFSTDQALAWLSQNKEILSPITTLPPSSPAQPQTPSSEAQRIENGLASNDEAVGGEKRKRELDTARPKGTEASERSTKKRRDPVGNGDEMHIKQGLQTEKQPSKLSTQSKQSSLSAARYSYTMADTAAKSKSLNEGRSGDASMTDALLAQVKKATGNTSPKLIKKEPISSRTAFSPPAEMHHHRSQDLPPKQLTCYYWKYQAGCNKRDEDCSYAHYDTGYDASAPNSWRYPASKRKYSSYAGQYDGTADSYGNPNGISIKGSHDGIDGSSTAPTGPRADMEGLPHGGSRWDSYDSYRPRS